MKIAICLYILITSAAAFAGAWDKIDMSPQNPTAGLEVVFNLDIDFKSNYCGYVIDYGDGDIKQYKYDAAASIAHAKIPKVYLEAGSYNIVVTGKSQNLALACPIAPIGINISVSPNEKNTSQANRDSIKSDNSAKDSDNLKVTPASPSLESTSQVVSGGAPESISQVMPPATYSAETKSSPRNEGSFGVLWIFVIAIAIVIYVANGGRKCPKCNSKKIELSGVTEQDRWRGVKRVVNYGGRLTSGRVGNRNVNFKSGTARTQHINTTYVENRYSYKCKECDFEWFNDLKEEK